MVATLLRLRWRIVRHQYRKDWWRVLSLAAGLIWSVSAVLGVLYAARELSFQANDVRHDALVGLGVLFGLGWLAVPLLVSGMDDALDPVRFASLGVPARSLVGGLALAALTTGPAIVFLGVGTVMASVWWRDGEGPWMVVMSTAGALVTVATWVIGARIATLWGARVLASRWGKLAGAGMGLAVAATVLWAVASLRADGLTSFFDYEYLTFTERAAVTPLGAGVAVPAHLAGGDLVGAWWRLGMVCAWLAVLMLAWRAAIASSLVSPLSRSGGAGRRDDAMIAAATADEPRARVVQAVRARSMRSWRSDPRYVSQVAGTLVTPLIFVGIGLAVFGVGDWLLLVAPMAAVMIGWARHNDVAFESSAIWIDIVAGVRGVDLVRGRLAAALSWSLPATALAALAAVAATGRWAVVVPVLATTLGALAVSLGVAAIMAVVFPYRVPAPGENPFTAQAGSLGASLISQALSSLGTGIAVPLVVGPLVAALVWGGPWWVVATVVGAVAGPVALVGGARAAGAVWHARVGRLLAAIA